MHQNFHSSNASAAITRSHSDKASVAHDYILSNLGSYVAGYLPPHEIRRKSECDSIAIISVQNLEETGLALLSG